MTAALKNPSFRRLAAALAASQIGDWMYNVALVMLVFERTGSTAWVALTTAARIVPIVALGAFGGVVADRFDRRRVMIACDLARMSVMGALGIVALAGASIVLMPVLAALATAAASPYPPAVAATTPRLVTDDALPGANALRAAIGAGGIVVGPAVGAILLALATPAAAFFANAGTFALSALLVASLSAGPAFAPGTRQANRVLADLREGAAALRASRPVLLVLGADVAVSAVYGAQTVLLAGRGYGLLIAAIGAGGLAGAGIGARAARSSAALVGSLLAVAASVALLGASPSLPVAMTLAAIAGAGSLVVEVLAETRMQRLLDEDVLARAYGLALPCTLAGIVAGAVVAAPLARLLGPAGAFVAVGAAVALYAALLSTSPRPRAVLV